VDRRIWESVVAEVGFNPDRTLSAITLTPISLGFKESRSQRGRPRPAPTELGRDIIQRLADLSAPFGTTVRLIEGQGVVVLGNQQGTH
jgi:poly-gamma-glutamate synthesis protein (capsule biosynthesis protein)